MNQAPASQQADIAANLAIVRGRIAAAARQAGRDLATLSLIAVSKMHGPETILPALAAGQQDFGENRVQEAMAKWPALRSQWPGVRLHLIGPLQSNKVRDAVALFDVIHTLDREKLARQITDAMAAQGRTPQLFIQVNIGREAQKAGVMPDATDRFIAQCRGEFGLNIYGLMCIPPADENPAPHFAYLAEIAARNGLRQLSMGMSNDYKVAIACGATHVRVGTAIFGTRIK